MAEIPTTWQPNPSQEGEFAQATIAEVIDPSGNFLTDPSGNNIIDTGQTFTQATTVWIDDAGL